MSLLNGIKVIDAAQFNAGPIVSMYLALMGADVIKVESLDGDDSRSIGPFSNNESSYFMSLNRGKRSISINLKTDDGIKLFKRIVEKSDILIENFSPGVMERLGIDWDVLKKINERLIYGSVTGFSKESKHSDRPAFDSLIQAASGLISVTGTKKGELVRVGVSIVDITTGLYLLSAVLLALWKRERDSKGRKIEASMLSAAVNILENPIVRHSFSHTIPEPEGLSHPVVSPFSGYKTKDGMIFIAISNTKRFILLVNSLGLSDLIEDTRFLDNESRVKNDKKLREILEKILIEKTTSEWEEILVPLGVPASAINNIQDTKEEFPEAFVDVVHSKAGSGLMPNSPFIFDEEEFDFSKPSPLLGEHTNEILTELNFGRQKIELLKSGKIVRDISDG